MKTRTFDSRKGQTWNPPRSPDLDLNQALRDLVGKKDSVTLRAWRERCYRDAEGTHFKAQPLMRAVQFSGSPWAVLELIAMGETPTTEMAMRCLDTCVQVANGGPSHPTFVSQVDVWHTLLDAAVKTDASMKKEAMEFVASVVDVVAHPRVADGLEQVGLDWEQMRLGEVFTPDTWPWTFEWRGPNSNKDEDEDWMKAAVPVSALQLAWANECWDACFHLLLSGLSASQTFPLSCWPAWTLRAALANDVSWMEGVNDLALIDVRKLVDARAQAGLRWDQSASLDRLHACMREQEMGERLPLARDTGSSRRF